MVSIDEYIDDIVTAVSINFENNTPINIADIIRQVKRKIISDALFQNFYIKERAAKDLNMSRTTLVEILKNQYYYKINEICKEHNIIMRHRKRNSYKTRRKYSDTPPAKAGGFWLKALQREP